MNKIIEVTNLTKKYDKLTAVDDISFSVEEGSFFAFLGPNGAGKSTTINILCTLLDKNKGTVVVNGFKTGKDDDLIRSSIGVVFQNSHLDDLLTVLENIKVRAKLYNITNKDLKERLAYIGPLIGIDDILNRKYGELSGGQKRRVDIARALVNEPKILFLDEPTTGLDPQTRKRVWEVLETIRSKKNITIFLTTHYMEEAEGADMVAIIDNGKIIAHDTPMKLKNKYTSNILKILPIDKNKMEDCLHKKKVVFTSKTDYFEIKVKSSKEALKILKVIENNIISFEVTEGNMDQLFINLTGKEIRGE